MKEDYGRLLTGDPDALRAGVEAFRKIPVDSDSTSDPFEAPPAMETTLGSPIQLQARGTFFGKALRTLRMEPAPAGTGWWMTRDDLPHDLPTRVSVRNVWTTGAIVSNIVLRSGAPHNYVRMVEHIIALKPGLGLDNVRVCLDSGDPPLFDRGSLDLVEQVDRVGLVLLKAPARQVTVTEPCCVCGPNGAFVALAPHVGPAPRLTIDAAVHFPNAIGRQRVRYDLDTMRFRTASIARTNTSASKKFYCQTLGRLFADVRNLGYTRENLLIAGRKRYRNEPRLLHEGKSLEAVWHRAALDLPAALALIDEGRLVGRVTSYRAGHALDVQFMTQLVLRGLLKEVAG
jgi:UDP-3-O-[3-hydroxymyristoyl] N-acetylglucosamine deacetylase